MAVTGVNFDRMQEQADEGVRDGGGRFKIPANSERIIYLCQPHENMAGLPFVKRLYHQRDLPDNSQGDFAVRCQRDDVKEDISHCWACRRMAAARRKKLVDKDAFDLLAQKYSPRKKPICQVVDITPLFDTTGQIQLVAGLKSCFMQFNQVEGCSDCFLKETCAKGVQRWYMPWKTYLEFRDKHFRFNGDITNPEYAIPVWIKREGKMLLTTYQSQTLPHAAMSLDPEALVRIQEAIQDLTPVDPKPTGTQEELDKIYRDFFELRDVAIEADGESVDDEAARITGAQAGAQPPPAKSAAPPPRAPAARPAAPTARPASPAPAVARPAAALPPKPAAPAPGTRTPAPANPATAAPARTPAPAKPAPAKPAAAAPPKAPAPAAAVPKPPAAAAPAKPAPPKPAAPATMPKPAAPKPAALPAAKAVPGVKPAVPAAAAPKPADPGLRAKLAEQARQGKMDKRPTTPPTAG